MKEAYDLHFAATIERAEKQIILAKNARRLVNLLDDTPVVPGDVRQPFAHSIEARQILTDAEAELQSWEPQLEPVSTSAGSLGANLMPTEDSTVGAPSESGAHGLTTSEVEAAAAPVVPAEKHTGEGEHLQAAIAS